ncbi:MAG TPA: SulP family inorganic anion transporter [Terriglobales bacterium]|nr:SulP family inorganic anion transporter [Terriglobales bacterium]
MKISKSPNLAGDFWGGLAAMLVALPSAIAFGVIIFTPLGRAYAAQGAVAGILGTIALGLVAPAFGGTRRLITTPSAPAAAVLSAFTLEATQKGVGADEVLVMLALVALLCALFQIGFGMAGLGKLIKYMPYPVVSGYLSGVGLIIILGQVPKFLGTPKDFGFWQSLRTPAAWEWHGLVVGAVTIVVMLTAGKLTKAVPAAILGLAAGVATYFGLSLADRSLLQLAGNKLVIGALAPTSVGFLQTLAERWQAMGAISLAELEILVGPAMTLAVLLSIDTLKTGVVLDALTHSRHNSNRELIGQGLGNLAATFTGGVPGSGQMGATLVNLSSGGQTRWSGLFEGALALVAFLALGRLVAWLPIAALAGILLVVGLRMIDYRSLHLLRSRATALDFLVIVTVVVAAETVGLIAASAVGIGLAILLFVGQKMGGSPVRRKAYGNHMFSKQMRLPEEMEILERRGDRTVICELQGSLFFGTADQLYSELEPEVKTRTYVILDMRRVQSVDFTAAHLLEQLEDMLSERKGFLIFSRVPANVPSGQDMQRYFDVMGLARSERHVRTFAELDDALEWVENRILGEEQVERAEVAPLELREIAIFQGRKEETLAALQSAMEQRSFQAGERIFSLGDTNDVLFLIRSGSVRVVLPLSGQRSYHLATFGRGDFFGEIAFLDGKPRSADAVASTDVELYALSRARFDALSEEHRHLAMNLMEGLARVIAYRMRHADRELRALEED